jgi:uncharacterized Zn-finger protein
VFKNNILHLASESTFTHTLESQSKALPAISRLLESTLPARPYLLLPFAFFILHSSFFLAEQVQGFLLGIHIAFRSLEAYSIEHRIVMAARSSMNARDSSGRNVSLLNDEPSGQASQKSILPIRSPNYSAFDHSTMVRSNSNNSGSNASSPCTPSLIRADSFDSQNTHDPRSPVTPTLLNEFGRQSSYTGGGYKDQPQFDYRDRMSFDDYSSNPQYAMPLRPSYADSRSSSYADPQMYEEDSYGNGPLSERGQKRYPCRFRDSMGCEKTFTTSGHASRHSKIHTAEKGVACEFPGCPKKFTRADNMKQHLETHTKDRSRSMSAQKPSIKTTLTLPAGVKKPSSSSNGRSHSRPSSRNAGSSVGNSGLTELPPLVDPALYASSNATYAAHHSSIAVTPSPRSPYGTFPHHITHLPEVRPIGHVREKSQSGLDALAMAADYQTLQK